MKITAYLLLLILLFVALARSTSAQSEAPAEGAGWVLKHANLDVRLEPKQKSLQVQAELRLRLEKLATSFGPTLGMNARATVLKFGEVICPGAELIELNLPHPKLESVRLARIKFAKPFNRGDELTVQVTYSSTGETNQFTIAEDIVLASWVVGWYPVPIPTMGESLNELMQAVGTTRFHLPKGWRAVSNGVLSDPKEAGETIETWQVSTPVARSFAAAPFKASASFQIGARTVGVYAITSSKIRAQDQAQVLVKALEVLEARFGPYPFPSYYIVEVPAHVPGFYGSSEQGFILTKPDAFIAGGNIALFAHEVAHGWWGNLITGTGDGGILLTEALSQYSAVLAIEAINGKTSATEFMRFSQTAYSPWQCAKGYFGISREGHDRALSQLTRGGFDHHLADSKGMWFYHMLRQEVGDDIFFATLRELIRRYAGKALALADLRQAFLQAAPRSGLATFFAQWLDRPGAPILEVKWTQSARREAKIIVTQAQKGEPYHLKLELGIETTDGVIRFETLQVNGVETQKRIEVAGPIKRVQLDPNHRLLIWQPEYGLRP